MTPKPLATVAGLALLVGTACSGGDDDPAAPDKPAEATTTTAGAAGSSAASAAETGASDGAAPGDTPEAGPLDVEVRHPSEVVLRLTRLAFEGDDVLLDAEIVNSSRSDVTFHQGNWSSSRLRLVDDSGEEYNFIEPTEDQPIELAPGETVSGTLAFRGPLRGQPAVLRMVNNIPNEEVDDWDMSTESESTIYPVFVVRIELTWP